MVICVPSNARLSCECPLSARQLINRQVKSATHPSARASRRRLCERYRYYSNIFGYSSYVLSSAGVIVTIWVVRQQTSGLSQPPDRQRHAATCTTEICVPELSAQLTNLQACLMRDDRGAARGDPVVMRRAQRRCNALKCPLEPADFKYEAQQLAT